MPQGLYFLAVTIYHVIAFDGVKFMGEIDATDSSMNHAEKLEDVQKWKTGVIEDYNNAQKLTA